MKVTERALSGITPYPNNPRNIPEAAIAQVARSIEAFGFRQPIVVDPDGVIIVGHTRYLAAHQLGLKKIPAHVMEVTDEQARAYRIADNRLGELSEWDNAALVEELEALEGLFDTTLTGFDMGELQAMLPPHNDAIVAGADDQGQLDVHKGNPVKCPHCGEEFVPTVMGRATK